MHGPRCLKPLLTALLTGAILAFSAAMATSPAVAGVGSGSVYDQFDNPIGGILVEALDPVTANLLASSTSDDYGGFSFELDPPESGSYKVRLSDPKGIFTTSYLYDRPSYEQGDLIGYI